MEELIHEFTHALPLRKLPPPLSSVEDIAIDTDSSLEEIEARMIRIGYLEEAVAFASSIHLIRELESRGVVCRMAPDLIRVAEVLSEQGIEGLCAAIPFIEVDESCAGEAKDRDAIRAPCGSLRNRLSALARGLQYPLAALRKLSPSAHRGRHFVPVGKKDTPK